MSDEHNNPASRLWLAVVSLTVFAALAGLAVSYTAQSTRERINTNQLAHAMRIVAEVLPADGYSNQPHEDVVMLAAPAWLNSSKPLPAYRARMNAQPVATAITTLAPDGYVGSIRLLVGIDAQGRLIGVRALEHRETPGLGDKIEREKSNWIAQFEGRQLAASNWQLQRDGGDFDHISGATITSRAVLNAIRRTLELQQDYGARISGAAAGSELQLEPENAP